MGSQYLRVCVGDTSPKEIVSQVSSSPKLIFIFGKWQSNSFGLCKSSSSTAALKQALPFIPGLEASWNSEISILILGLLSPDRGQSRSIQVSLFNLSGSERKKLSVDVLHPVKDRRALSFIAGHSKVAVVVNDRSETSLSRHIILAENFRDFDKFLFLFHMRKELKYSKTQKPDINE